MLFDTHAHYDDERFDGDREALLAGMPEKNVGLIVNPGCDISSSRTAVALAESFDFVYAAVGIHPENCGDFEPGMIDRLRQMAKNPRVVAIGEIGLTGELRAVSALGQRLSEVRRIGFTKCLIPARNSGKLTEPEGLQLIRVRNIREALAAIL